MTKSKKEVKYLLGDLNSIGFNQVSCEKSNNPNLKDGVWLYVQAKKVENEQG